LRGALLAVFLTLGVAVLAAPPSRAGQPLRLRPVARAEDVARFQRLGLPAPAVIGAEEARVQGERERLWRSFHDVLSAPGVDWSLRAQRRTDWRAPATGPASARSRVARLQGAAGAAADTPPETLRVAFLLIDFRADRGGGASSGDGHFDLSGPDTNAVPIDPPPHDRRFFEEHLEALARYYDATSYGRVVVTGDVWPREPRGAYSVSDMADFGPWKFSPDIYPAALHMFRTMLFAADSQSVLRGDRIPWDSYDRFALIHAGSDLQDDVRQDSPEDIPSFTIGVADSDAVIFPDSTNRPIDRASLIPEYTAQDGYYGAINGVLAHESGHNFFGFADVYNIETGFPVVGYWSLMDSGNLVGSLATLKDGTEIFATGLLPPSVDPWQRSFTTDVLGFPEIVYDSVLALTDSERNPDLRRVTLSSDEYLLLENRHLAPADTVQLDQDSLTHVVLGPKSPDRFEYDALLPGTGILVWHIDESVIPFATSLRVNADYGFNTNPDRYGISLVEGDGLQDLGDPGSPFFLGAPFDPWFLSNNPVLGDSTFPPLRPHIGTRPHKRIAFLDDPAPVMHVQARRTWELPGWPVAGDFPPGGPLLLAVDADGDGKPDVCWAGGRDSVAAVVDGHVEIVGNPDSSALFAVRFDGLGLDGTSTLAFAHLDARPRPELAAIARGDSGAWFAASTYAAGPDTSSPGGRVWLLDHLGRPLPGWPAALPAVVTTPPVIVGRYPDAWVHVGCADGAVYQLGLDGSIVRSVQRPGGPVTGRLAADYTSGPLWDVAFGCADGTVTVAPFWPPGIIVGVDVPPWFRSLGVTAGFAPDFLWIPLDGAPRVIPLSPSASAGAAVVCGVGTPALVVHYADKLWAFCPDGTPIAGWGHSFGDTIVAGLGGGDPDGDDLPEVLTQTRRSALAFVNRTGYPSPGWPKRGTSEDLRTDSPPLALDVDRDGRCEIVGMNASGIVAAVRADGNVPDGWPLASGSGATGSPVAADLNRDGTLDLVVPDRFGLLYGYTLPVPPGSPQANSWTMLGGGPGRESALSPASSPPGPVPVSGPLAGGSFMAYPNPARRHPVSFAYRLTEPADVEFRILDTSGHEVASFSRPGLQGENVQIWEPGSLPAGLYLARARFRGVTSERVEVLTVGLLR
jgi:M6 family metalloprotease-like protein